MSGSSNHNGLAIRLKVFAMINCVGKNSHFPVHSLYKQQLSKYLMTMMVQGEVIFFCLSQLHSDLDFIGYILSCLNARIQVYAY